MIHFYKQRLNALPELIATTHAVTILYAKACRLHPHPSINMLQPPPTENKQQHENIKEKLMIQR